MVAIRDLKCSMDIAEMAALGKFEQEFMVYGCCYQEKGNCFIKSVVKVWTFIAFRKLA